MAFTYLPDGKLLQITASQRTDRRAYGAAGAVVAEDKNGFYVNCSDGVILITEVIPEGKGKMRASYFVRGRKISVGDVLGAPCKE